MIIGTGVDLVDVERLRAAVTRTERFAKKVFTEGEMAYCRGKAREYEHLAGRFAAKEAMLKALGTGIERESSLRDVEVQCDPQGRPEVVLHGATRQRAQAMGVARIHLSISHAGQFAVAMVVAEGA